MRKIIKEWDGIPCPAPTGTIKVLETFTALEIQQLKEIMEHWNNSLGVLCIDENSKPKFISLKNECTNT